MIRRPLPLKLKELNARAYQIRRTGNGETLFVGSLEDAWNFYSALPELEYLWVYFDPIY